MRECRNGHALPVWHEQGKCPECARLSRRRRNRRYYERNRESILMAQAMRRIGW